LLDPQDKDGKARECYESAVRLDPQLSPPMANLGILCFRAGKSDEAEKHFKKYLAAQPEDAQAWVNLGLLYLAKVQANTSDARAIASATNALQKAIRIEPGSFSAYKAMGGLYLTIGRTNEAFYAYQTSLKLNPDQPLVRQLLADRFSIERPVETPALATMTRSGRSRASDASEGSKPVK